MQVRLVRRLTEACEYRWAKFSGKRFTKWLQQKGCKVGEGVHIGMACVISPSTRPGYP